MWSGVKCLAKPLRNTFIEEHVLAYNLTNQSDCKHEFHRWACTFHLTLVLRVHMLRPQQWKQFWNGWSVEKKCKRWKKCKGNDTGSTTQSHTISQHGSTTDSMPLLSIFENSKEYDPYPIFGSVGSISWWRERTVGWKCWAQRILKPMGGGPVYGQLLWAALTPDVTLVNQRIKMKKKL